MWNTVRNDMAKTSHIRFRCSPGLTKRARRIARIRFGIEGNNKLSALGREAITEYVVAKEKEYGVGPVAAADSANGEQSASGKAVGS
jgi:hypothetical protein